MVTGKPELSAADAFRTIARDPTALRSFLQGIGNEHAPSRLRAADLLLNCESVADVGCGPALMWNALAACGWRGRYVGADPVEELLHLAQKHVPAAIDVTRAADGLVRSHDIGQPHALVLDDPTAFLKRCRTSRFAGVLLRHVLEHLPEPWQLLQAAADATSQRLVVVLSRSTRVAGGITMPLLTDRYLGALRWSHWRPTLMAVAESRGLECTQHVRGDGLVADEELFVFDRAGTPS